ncbi:hypothetical protein [Paenibacillus ginsengihumi]|uniref:hypothetical protein n=1 Tax=Paenibacillus ginsengihumi TaxID=431596 RepID=UPI000375B49A|nr:hypothetical protein [Paenibacillus ginsengihumi]
MNRLEAQELVKLHILQSLARSQRALARMIESMADLSEISGAAARDLAEHAEAIARCQRAIAANIAGVRFRRIRRGRPGKVWFSDKLRPGRRAGAAKP